MCFHPREDEKIIPAAKKVDTFLAVLCLTPVRPWRTAPAGPSFTTVAAFAAMPCSALFCRGRSLRPTGLESASGGRSRGPYTSEYKSHFQWPLVLYWQPKKRQLFGPSILQQVKARE